MEELPLNPACHRPRICHLQRELRLLARRLENPACSPEVCDLLRAQMVPLAAALRALRSERCEGTPGPPQVGGEEALDET